MPAPSFDLNVVSRIGHAPLASFDSNLGVSERATIENMLLIATNEGWLESMSVVI